MSKVSDRWPPGTWHPPAARIERANIVALQQALGMKTIPELHRWSVEHLDGFLSITIRHLGIRFRLEPNGVVDLSQGAKAPRWLPGAKLNIVESCFNAPGESDAIVFSTENGSLARWTYDDLRALCNRASNGVVSAGFAPGDALAMYMPMTPQAVAIYLGIIQAGCVVVSIAESFAAEELARRLRIANARAIFTASEMTRGGKRISLYDRVVSADAPRTIVLTDAQRDTSLRKGDVLWSDFLPDDTQFSPVACDPADPINVLFSSGTTGDPKAIPFDHTTPIKCAMDAHYHHDLHPGDVAAWPTSLGWMMGPWLVFAALINRGTIAMHHDVPGDRAFGEFVRDARVSMLGVVPGVVRRWRETNCMSGIDLGAVQTFSSTGECSKADDMIFLMQLAGGKPVIEYCGGTEIGGGFITSTVAQPNIPSAFSTPALGSELVLLDENFEPADAGELFLIPPAIGLSFRLLNGDHERVYYADAPAAPGGTVLRRHGDRFERLPNGYYRAMGRADDTMNLAGIKVSSAEIERAVSKVAGMSEAAAVAVNPPDGGPSLLVLFVVAQLPSLSQMDLKHSLQRAISERLNPLFKVHDVVIVRALPRTASQKVMRRELRAQYLFPGGADAA